MSCLMGACVGTGASAQVFEWGEDKVIKLFNPNTDIYAVKKEFHNTLAAWEKGINVPQPYEMIELEEGHGIIYRKVIGETLIDKLWKEMSNVTDEIDIKVDNEEEVDGIKLTARILYDINKNSGKEMKVKQKDSLKESIKRAPYLINDEKNTIYRYIDNLPEKECLCHGDLNPCNVILCDEKPVIIDWMNATSGNPAGDVAELITIYKYSVLPAETPRLYVEAFNSTREILCNTFVNEYMKLSHISYEEIEAWILPIAAAKLVTESKAEEEKTILLRVIREKLKSIN